jgi:hypothetical protein
MPAVPQRNADPAPLHAHLVPLERALHERARVLDDACAELEDQGAISAEVVVRRVIAAEFRTLALEIHHWT